MRPIFPPVLLVAVLLSAHGVWAQAPANDNFANRIALTTALPITAAGTTAGATSEAGEPDHANATAANRASNSVWSRWTSTVTGTVAFTVSNAAFDSIIGVYTGNAVTGLTLVGSADEFAIGDETAAVRVVTGVTYSIAVDGFSTARGVVENSGTFNLQIAFVPRPINDDFDDAFVLDPTFPTGANGTAFGATVEAAEPDHGNAIFGNFASNSVWYRWTAPSTETVIASSLGQQIDGVVAVYTGTLAGGLNLVGAADFFGPAGIEKVPFNAVAGTTYSIAVDAWSTARSLPAGGWPFVVTLSRPPANDQFAARQDLGNALPVAFEIGSAIGASAEAGEPDHANAASANEATSTVWYQWTAPRAALIGVDVESELMDSILAVYTGTSFAGLTEVASVDLTLDGIKKRAVFEALAATTYVIAVDGYSTDATGVTPSEDLFTLSILEVPPNDHFSDATDLFDLALPLTRQGTTLNASNEFLDGEPDHAITIGANLASNSVWYRWTATTAEEVNVVLRNIAFDGVLAVYSVAADGTTLTEVAAADAIGEGVQESLTFTSVAGQDYAIAVDVYSLDGLGNDGGPFTLDIGGQAPIGVYNTWIARFPSITGAAAQPAANPAGDGVSNLIKLVLGLDPTLRLADDPNRGNYPKLREFNGGPALEYVIAPENLGSGPEAILHGGEVSTTDLKSWADVGALNIGGNTWVIEIQAVGADARFGRMKVTDPAG